MTKNQNQKSPLLVSARPEAVIAWANLELLSLKSGRDSSSRSEIADGLLHIAKALEKNPQLRRNFSSLALRDDRGPLRRSQIPPS